MNAAFKKSLCGCAVASALCLSSILQAQVVIDYSVAGIASFPLPSGNGASPGDTLTLDAYPSSGTATLDLTYGVTQTGELNPFNFFTASSQGRGGMTVSLARDLTVNGISQSISQSAVDDYEEPYDTLTINAGDPLVFNLGASGFLTVTPLAAGAGGPNQAVFGNHNSEIDADFLLTPVPDASSTGLLFGISLGALRVVRRRLSEKAKC